MRAVSATGLAPHADDVSEPETGATRRDDDRRAHGAAADSQHRREPPTPGGVPLLGNGWAFVRDPTTAMERWADLDDVVRLSMPGREIHMVTDPAAIERVLVNEAERFSIGPAQREFFEGAEDDAVTTATGDRWKRLRRALHPAFAPGRIDAYSDGMAATTARIVDEWEDGATIDLAVAARILTVDVLADALLGVDVRGEEDVVTDAADAIVDRANFRRPGHLLPDWVPTPTERRFRRRFDRLEAFVESVLTQGAPGRRADAMDDGDDHDDVLSTLRAARERGALSAAEVRGNLTALLLAGHEGPSTAFTMAWYLLSEHPDVLDGLQDEYAAVVDGDRPAGDDHGDLVLTRRVVAETLRLYPPTTAVNRQTTEPVTLGGYDLPEGTQLMLPQWVLHRDGRFWDEPERFDPDRWADATADRPEYAYFPFSGGPRQCPGNEFARRALVLALATTVGRVELDVALEGELSFTPSIQLRPAVDVGAAVRRR